MYMCVCVCEGEGEGEEREGRGVVSGGSVGGWVGEYVLVRVCVVLCCVVVCLSGYVLCVVSLKIKWSSTASSGKANDWRTRERVVLDLFSNLEWVRTKGFFR